MKIPRRTKFFIDTEFYERGPRHPITLISLGIVCEDGREFYAENTDVDLAATGADALSPWLKQNVVPHLVRGGALPPTVYAGSLHTQLLPHASIGQAIAHFVGNDTPEFWAYFADYDWVLFSQLFGSMLSLPPTFPQFCLDLKQELYLAGAEKPSLGSFGAAHNALADARWNKALYDFLFPKR